MTIMIREKRSSEITAEGMTKEMTERNVVWQLGKVSYEERCRYLKQRGLVIWFTGLSGAGKSTIAVELEKELLSHGRAAYRLDGDNIRMGLNSDLGFSESDRNENIRRTAEVAALFQDAGLIVLVAFISPYREMREKARTTIGSEHFSEIYVKADLETCEKRDTKGFYRKARLGQIENFTGISDVYEEPEKPDLILDTESMTVEEAVQQVLKVIEF